MFSFMKSKPGRQQCPKCGGQGCWSCERRGYTVQCPNCLSGDETISKSGNTFQCQCGFSFDSAGNEQAPLDPYS